jgi:hypothetical protein
LVFADPASSETKRRFGPSVRLTLDRMADEHDEAMRREYGM